MTGIWIRFPGSFSGPDIIRVSSGNGISGLGDGSRPIDWNRDIDLTPIDLGFDESFIFPATADRVPCVYVEGRRVANLDPEDPIEVSYEEECPFADIPTYHKNPELLTMRSSHGHDMSIVGGIGRIGYMRGGEKAVWKDEDLAETFLNRALRFVRDSHEKEQPFFLYYALSPGHGACAATSGYGAAGLAHPVPAPAAFRPGQDRPCRECAGGKEARMVGKGGPPHEDRRQGGSARRTGASHMWRAAASGRRSA